MKASLLIQALQCKNFSRPPVWFMRQAGRHLESYRKLRGRYSFLELCHEPDLITEVSLLPIKAYQVDAAILFSDILLVVEAMGLKIQFQDSQGPLIEKPLENGFSVASLPLPVDLSGLTCIQKGVEQLKKTLNIPLIGFAGAPFTLASYMIEGKTNRETSKTKRWIYADPESFHSLLDKLADWVAASLLIQIRAGADAVQLFDSWANALTPAHFRLFCLPYLRKVMHLIRVSYPHVPILLFCRNSALFAPLLAEPSPQGISLDWSCSVKETRKQLGPSIALQGNLDPHLLYAPLSQIKKEANLLLDSMSGDPGYIFNLGHGILPDVSEEAVRTLVECVKERN